MATQTQNYNLTKPAATDFYDVGDQNDNMDIIDGKLAEFDITKNTEESTIVDADAVQFYDTSATSRKKITWANIIAVIKSALGAAAVKGVDTTVTSGSTNLPTSGAVYTSLAGKSDTDHTHDDRYYTETEVTSLLAGKSNTSHTQAASTITTGTFPGKVKAPASTDYTTAELRNAVVVSTDPGAGVSVSYPNGTIIFVEKG